MTKFVAATVFALLFGGGVASNQHFSSRASVARVQDTLRSLLKSVQDDGRNKERLFNQRHRWCEASLQVLDTRSDEFRLRSDRFRADLGEQQATFDEARGAAQQLRAEIALVQNTMSVVDGQLKSNSSANPSKALSALVEHRRLALPSLQEELKMLLPELSQLQAELVETKRQIADQGASAASIDNLAHAIRDGCASSNKRANSQSTARVNEATSLEGALQALEKLGRISVSDNGAVPTEDGSSDQEDLTDPTTLALLQVSSSEEDTEATSAEDDLFSVFGGTSSRAAHHGHTQHSVSSIRTKHLADDEKSDDSPRQVGNTSPTPASLLSRLQADGAVGKMRRAWCLKEKSRNQQLLKQSRAAIARLAAEASAHADAETDLQEHLAWVQTGIDEAESMAKVVANSTLHEHALLETETRDQVLAIKILRQAGVILGSIDAGGEAAAQVLSEAAKDVSAASAAFEAQANRLKKMQTSVKTESNAVATASFELSRNLARERQNLQLAQNSHSSLRMRSEKSRLTHEAEAKATEDFLRELAMGCEKSASTQEEHRRSAEIHALEDATRVLAGQRVQRASVEADQARGLRGPKRTPAVDVSKLSPIERAALEMGVSTDAS